MTTHDTLMALADVYSFHRPGSERSDEARAALSAAIADLVAERDEHQTNAMRNARSAVSFKAERDALAKDAARYRAIREGLEVDPDNSGIVVSLIDDFGGETLRNEQADEAIDQALKGTPT